MRIFQISPVICAAILCAGLAIVRADDTPAQAAARAALLEKMNAQGTSPDQPSQPAPVTVTPAGAAMEPTAPPSTNSPSAAWANDNAKAQKAAAAAKAKADAQQAADELKAKKLAEKKAAQQKAADEAAAKAQAKAKAKADKAAAKAKAKAEAQQAAAELKARQQAEAAAKAQAAAKPASEAWATPASTASPAPMAAEEEMAPVKPAKKPAKKKKPVATPPATSSAPAWAAGDNEAQAKARAALLEKMNETAAEPTPAVPTPAPIMVTPAGATMEQPNQPAISTAPAQPAVEAAMTAPAQPTKPVVEKKKKKKKKKVAAQTAPGATQPGQPAATSFPGKELGMQPIVAPPLPITATKEEQLQALLAKYMADQISPEEYHKQRAAILDQP